jgi:hypothetical protein
VGAADSGGGAFVGAEESTGCVPSSDVVDCSCFVKAPISAPSSMTGGVRYAAQNVEDEESAKPVKSSKERAYGDSALQRG